MTKSLSKQILQRIPLKQQLFSALRHLPIPESVYRHLHFDGYFDISLPGGGSFRMNHFGLRIENEFFWAGYGNRWERTSLRLWEAFARTSTSILDIGANTGSYAMAAKAANPSAEVHAFEPVARIYRRLAKNVDLNGGSVHAHMVALSDHNGSSVLYDDGGDHTYSASLNSQMQGEFGRAAQSEVLVQTLDSWVSARSAKPPDLMKIDAEMHEPQVLAGAAQAIATGRPAVLIEVLTPEIGREVEHQLPGYVFFEIMEGVGVSRVAHPGEKGARNFLSLPCDDPRLGRIGNSLPENAIATARLEK